MAYSLMASRKGHVGVANHSTSCLCWFAFASNMIHVEYEFVLIQVICVCMNIYIDISPYIYISVYNVIVYIDTYLYYI